MRHLLALAILAATPAAAQLAPGARAPVFTAPGAIAGKASNVDLKAALKKGAVVLYFFPAAFTNGCNVEAAAFAEALPDFQKARASVIGMTAGNVDQLQKFSAEHCAGKFAVAAASPAIIRGYDVVGKDAGGKPNSRTTRTSYVIAPNGKVIFAYSGSGPADHIRMTLDAVRTYRKSHPRG